MDKEKMKSVMQQLLALDPILITKLEPKLKPKAKIIYYVLMGILVLALLGAIVSVFRVDFSIFLLELLLIVINFVIVRMFCEYLNKA